MQGPDLTCKVTRLGLHLGDKALRYNLRHNLLGSLRVRAGVQECERLLCERLCACGVAPENACGRRESFPLSGFHYKEPQRSHQRVREEGGRGSCLPGNKQTLPAHPKLTTQ